MAEQDADMTSRSTSAAPVSGAPFPNGDDRAARHPKSNGRGTRRSRAWHASVGPTTVPAVVIFVVTPLMLIIIGALIVLPEPRHRVLAFRSFLVLTLCLLPATMWYLFIATRKASLLNDFVTSLNRLGLLQPQEYEDKEGPARRRRIYAYLQKFEATYGPVSPTVRRNILDGKFNPDAPEGVPASASGKPSDLISATTTVPIILATALTGLGWLITLPPSYPGNEPLEIVEQPLTYAFLGAYFFSLQMLFRRYVRKDLRGSAYVAVAMRIILGVIGTGVAVVGVRLLNPSVAAGSLLIVGFTIGVFPKVAWQVVQTAFRQVTGIVIQSLRTESPLTDLDGLTVWHEARLEEEDIENVPNMATADIVELLLNTRMPPNRLIDWVDQAILYTHLGQGGAGKARSARQRDEDRRHGLRRLGIRTATSFMELPLRDEATVDALRSAGIEPSSLVFLQGAVRMDANFALVCRWRCLSVSAASAPRASGSVGAVLGSDGHSGDPVVAARPTPA
jgi:hypothetical protein